MQESLSSVHPELQDPSSNAFDADDAAPAPDAPHVSQRHLAKLERAVRSIIAPHVEQDPPLAIWIAGEPGVGKSALVGRVRTLLTGAPVIFLETRCYPHTGEVLEPILAAARRLLQQVALRMRQDEPGWDAIWQQIVVRHAPALERVLPEIEWGVEVRPYPDLDPELERNRLLDHLSGLFLRVAEEVPTLITIDGAEHLDGLSCELLATLAQVCRVRHEGRRAQLPLPSPPRLGVILTTHTEDPLPLALSDNELVPIVLSGLGREEFSRLLQDEYGEEIPLSTRERLYQATRGNPLELTVRIRREREEGHPRTPQDRARRMLDFGTFEQELSTQLRRAGVGERSMLQLLAVLEKPISVALLSRLLDMAPEGVNRSVELLEMRGWVQRVRGAVGLAHARARGPILDHTPPAERLQLHRRCAELIRSEYDKRPYRRFQEVYYHYASGPQDPEALEAGLAAAEECVRLYHHDGAIRIYAALLEVVDERQAETLASCVGRLAELLALSDAAPTERLLERLERLVELLTAQLPAERVAGLWRRLGGIARHWGLSDRELACYREGLALLEGHERSHERMLTYACVARHALQRRQYDEGLRICQDVLPAQCASDLPDDPELLELCRVTEEVHFHRGNFVEAIAFEERYLQLARQQHDPQRTFASYLRLAYLHEQRGQPERAQRCLEEAAPIARATGSRLLMANIDERIGYLHARLEQWSAATDAFRRALEAQAEIGTARRTVRTLGALGMVALLVGDATAGASHFRLYALHQSLRGRRELPQQVPGLPCDYHTRSERDEEIRLREDILARARGNGAGPVLGALSELADLRRDRGEYDGARATLRRALRLAPENTLDTARLHLQLGVLYQQQGEVEAALDELQAGLGAMQGGPDRELVAESNVQVGILQLARGQQRRALGSLVRGLRTYLELEHETGVAHTLIRLVDAYLGLGQQRPAEELAQAALALAHHLGVDRLEAEAWLRLAVIRGRRDAGAPGHQEVSLARELFHKLGILEGRARALLVEAEIYLRWSDHARASALAAEALEIARDLGLRPVIAHALAVRGAIEGDPRARGDFIRALQTLESALEHAAGVGARNLLLRVHGTLADLYHQRNSPGVARNHLVEARKVLDSVLADAPPEFHTSLRDACDVQSLLRLYELEYGTVTPAG